MNTHRVFSRNTASSRAIPVSKTIKDVLENPVIPIWNLNQKGMSGTIEGMTFQDQVDATEAWLESRDKAVEMATQLVDVGMHKQIANRLLEPFMWTKQIVTSDQWDNFFNLRIHEGAQPEIMELAIKMRDAINSSFPNILKDDEWHLPYVTKEEKSLPLKIQWKISVARCARVSYLTHSDGQTSTVDKDTVLYDTLLREKHFSPFEHQASPITLEQYNSGFQPKGNFRAFNQLRHNLEH